MSQDRAAEFKNTVEEKIESLLDDFARGDISREHFDMVYARYSRQLNIAENALQGGGIDQLHRVMREIPTMALRAAIRGKALGMLVIHHLQMDILRTFGDHLLDPSYLNPIMDALQTRLQNGQTEYTQVQKLYSNTWVIVCTLEHTSLITLFRNEPAAKQVQELERRHRDFESANRNILNHPCPDPDVLVYPVELFGNR